MNLKEKLTRFFEINNYVFTILGTGLAISMAYVFVIAYAVGFQLTIDINHFNEANLELVIILTFLLSLLIKGVERGFKR